jgi:hypothetical protein
MTLVYQTKYGPPDGNCLAACVATLLNKRIEDVDVDVASCGSSLRVLLTRIGEKAKCKIYAFHHEAIVDGVVKSTERYCIVAVCSCVFDHSPLHPNSTWHSVVCEIAEDGKLSLVFNPDPNDQRSRSLQQFGAIGNLFIVKGNLRS